MPVQSAPFDGRQKLLVGFYVLFGHLHIATGKEGVQFRAALLTPAILYYALDGFIYPRRLREARDLVAESLGFVS